MAFLAGSPGPSTTQLRHENTIASPVAVSLPSLPAITLTFPASTPLAGKSVYYGISDLNAQGGLVSFIMHGPATISGQKVSFALVPTPISFEAGHEYTFVVYATGTVADGATGKIYVVNRGNSRLTTYNADGTLANPKITAGLSGPSDVAVDAAGKLYVADPDYGAVRTFNADGTQSTPDHNGRSERTQLRCGRRSRQNLRGESRQQLADDVPRRRYPI